jgi:hypothetical protein
MQLLFKPDGVYRTDGSLFFYYNELSDDINNKCPISYSSTIVPIEISTLHPEGMFKILHLSIKQMLFPIFSLKC